LVFYPVPGGCWIITGFARTLKHTRLIGVNGELVVEITVKFEFCPHRRHGQAQHQGEYQQ
jgi:hypothetical protein